jgi:hypothetical protein
LLVKPNGTRLIYLYLGGTIGKKLAVSFAPLAIVVAVLALYLQTTIVTIGKSEDLAIDGLSRKVQRAGALDQLAERMRSDSRGLLLATYAHNPKFEGFERLCSEGGAEGARKIQIDKLAPLAVDEDAR